MKTLKCLNCGLVFDEMKVEHDSKSYYDNEICPGCHSFRLVPLEETSNKVENCVGFANLHS